MVLTPRPSHMAMTTTRLNRPKSLSCIQTSRRSRVFLRCAHRHRHRLQPRGRRDCRAETPFYTTFHMMMKPTSHQRRPLRSLLAQGNCPVCDPHAVGRTGDMRNAARPARHDGVHLWKTKVDVDILLRELQGVARTRVRHVHNRYVWSTYGCLSPLRTARDSRSRAKERKGTLDELPSCTEDKTKVFPVVRSPCPTQDR
jgi:hypothetical protein